MTRFTLAAGLALLAPLAFAAPPQPFTGTDLSGVYSCVGHDALEGEYKANVTLTLNRDQSSGDSGSYGLKMVVPDYGVYLGSVVSNGDMIAITFAHTDPKTHDYGTGLGEIKKDAQGNPGFSKFYYEPEFRGGDHGTEECSRQSTLAAN